MSVPDKAVCINLRFASSTLISVRHARDGPQLKDWKVAFCTALSRRRVDIESIIGLAPGYLVRWDEENPVGRSRFRTKRVDELSFGSMDSPAAMSQLPPFTELRPFPAGDLRSCFESVVVSSLRISFGLTFYSPGHVSFSPNLPVRRHCFTIRLVLKAPKTLQATTQIHHRLRHRLPLHPSRTMRRTRSPPPSPRRSPAPLSKRNRPSPPRRSW